MAEEKWSRTAEAAVLLSLLLLPAAGCAEEVRALRVAETVPVEEEGAATLTVGADGRWWIGAPGVMRIRSRGGTDEALRVPGRGAPRVQAWFNGAVYLRVGDALAVVHAGADTVTAFRGGFGESPVVLDVRGRALLQGASSGAVLAHDPDSLAPIWAWPALGSRTSALAGSPEGDRVYQALLSDDGDARLLIRDLQTGRELGSVELPAPIERLAVGDDGVLYGVAREGRRGVVVVALRPWLGDLELVWRRELPTAESGEPVWLAVAGAGVAVWGLGPRIGLRLLDARTGEILGRTRTEPLDASFRPGAGLWALYEGSIRRLE